MIFEKYLVDPNDYEEECVIGEGNYSFVWLVHPKNNKKVNVALKKININLNENNSQKFFIRELLIMTKINHPCLIKLIGFSLPSKRDQVFKIYSEYMPNKSLIDILKNDDGQKETNKKLTHTSKMKIIYGIVSGMSYLHKKNIVHRDLKPENIFLNSKYEPVISDFGLSKICNNTMRMTGKLGTPYFMAPELFYDEEDGNDRPLITNKIDVYSFAVTLLSFFTTNYKFIGCQPRTISQLIDFVTNGKRYRIPKDVPPFFENLINRCWSNDADDRPSFDEILELFETSDEFKFEGADLLEVNEYIQNLKNYNQDDEMRKSNNKFFLSSFSEEETNEYEETDEFNF